MRRWVFRLLLLLMGTLLSLVGLEGYARARQPEMPAWIAAMLDPSTRSCATTSPSRGYVIEGRCGRDARGFILPAPGIAGDTKPTAPLTVLLIGDSVAEKAWGHALAPALAATLDRPIRLYNGAVSGYGTCQESLALRELRATLVAAGDAPGLILAQSCANDRHGSPVLLPTAPVAGFAMIRAGKIRMPRLLLYSAAAQQAFLYPALQIRNAPLNEDDLLSCLADMREAAGDTPLIALHFPVLAEPGDSRFAADLLDEAAIQSLYDRAGVPGVPLRPLLPAKLSALRTSPDDQLHPGSFWSHNIAGAAAPAIAAMLP